MQHPCVSVGERCVLNHRGRHKASFDSFQLGGKGDIGISQSLQAIPANLRIVEALASISANTSYFPTVLGCAHLSCSYASRTFSFEMK
jgi:hypothetical protein